MRSLHADLLTAQRADILDPKISLAFTHGVDEENYNEDVIVSIPEHHEELYDHHAEIVLDNSAGTFTEKNYKGWKVQIKYGLVTASGNRWSTCAPLWVTVPRLDSTPGSLRCSLTLVGIPNLLAEDKASDNYLPEEDDTKTVQTLIREIAGDSGVTILPCFNHCTHYDVVFDSTDSLIGTYKPKDGFRIFVNGSRLAALRRLIDYTKCVMRFEADGKIHVLQPTISGESYDYEYTIGSGHEFFSKAYQKALVIPNYVVVKSLADDDPQYSGFAKDDESAAALEIREYKATRLESDAQGANMADALLSKYQLHAEMGAADALMNCGAEVMDYVKVTDSREEDYRIGNIGSLTRWYGEGEYHIRFSFGGWLSVRKILTDLEVLSDEGAYFNRLQVKDLYAENIMADNIDMVWMDPEGNIDLSKIGDDLDGLPDGEVYARVKSVHMDAGIIQLDEHIFYKAGYNPTDKFDLGSNDLDDIPEGTTYQRVKSTAIEAGLIKLSDVVQVSGYRTTSDAEKGTWNGKPDNMDEIPDGSTYRKLLNTDIAAGHIKLTSAVTAAGKWYSFQGIEIDASQGITIDNAVGGYSCFRFKRGSYYSWMYQDTVGDFYIYSEKRIRLMPASAYNIYVESDLAPWASNSRWCGLSNHYWAGVCSYYYYAKDASFHTWQDHDDIEIVKNIRAKTIIDENGQEKHIIDSDSLHSDLKAMVRDPETGAEEEFLLVNNMASLALGTCAKLAERLEALERKVA